MGERLRLRTTGDLLGGLRTRLGGEQRRGGGDRLRIGGLPRILRGEPLGGDLIRLEGDDGERPLTGDAGLLLGGGDSLRRTGEFARRRGEESVRLGEMALRATGDLLGERRF